MSKVDFKTNFTMNMSKDKADMSHSQMLGKFEYGGGPIFKVVIEC